MDSPLACWSPRILGGPDSCLIPKKQSVESSQEALETDWFWLSTPLFLFFFKTPTLSQLLPSVAPADRKSITQLHFLVRLNRTLIGFSPWRDLFGQIWTQWSYSSTNKNNQDPLDEVVSVWSQTTLERFVCGGNVIQPWSDPTTRRTPIAIQALYTITWMSEFNSRKQLPGELIEVRPGLAQHSRLHLAGGLSSSYYVLAPAPNTTNQWAEWMFSQGF